MAQPIPDRFLEKSLLAVQDALDAPESLRARVFRAIDDIAAKARSRVSPGLRFLRFFTDMPPVLAAAAALVLAISPMALYRLTAPSPLALAVRSAEGATAGRGRALAAGGVTRTGRSFRTGEGGHVSLSFERMLAFHLFERSSATVTEKGRAKGEIRFRLGSGAMYLSRARALPGREVAVSILDHEVRLMGTTLYAEFLSEKSYRLICREGALEIHAKGAKGALLSRVEAGAYVDMKADGTVIARGSLDSLPAEYRRMFERLALLSLPGDQGTAPSAGPLPFRILGLGGMGSSSGQGGDPVTGPLTPPDGEPTGGRSGADDGHGASREPGSTMNATPEPPPFTVRSLGKLASFKPEGAQRTIGRICALKDGKYAILHDGLYRLTESGFEKRLPFAKPPAAAPLVVSGRVLVFYQDRLVSYAETLDDPVETLFPREGSLQNGYGPALVGQDVLIPLQGAGLYRYSPASRALDLAEAEVFPAGPLALDGGYLASTFYKNKYSKRGADGKVAWEYLLPGRSYLDPLTDGFSFYLYAEDDAGQSIIVLDGKGAETRRIALPESIVADLAIDRGVIFGVSSKGNLLRADPRAGTASIVKRLYAGTMTSAQWRNLRLAAEGGRLATLTDEGELEGFALPAFESVLKTRLPGGSPYDLQPFAVGNRFYAVGRGGETSAVELTVR